MALAEPMLPDESAQAAAELEKPQQVCKRRWTLAQALGQFLLGEAVVPQDAAAGFGFIQEVQIFPLEIFNEAHQGAIPVRGSGDDGVRMAPAQ